MYAVELKPKFDYFLSALFLTRLIFIAQIIIFSIT